MSVVICVIMFHCHVEFDLAVGLTGKCCWSNYIYCAKCLNIFQCLFKKEAQVICKYMLMT